MQNQKFVSYLRISTMKQEISGLGLEGQRASVASYLSRIPQAELLREITETESGGKNDRPKLLEALSLCKQTGATLIIAKLDRLSRNAAFLLGLQDSKTPFVCVDFPDANELTIGILAVMAQHERRMIASRTKAALQVIKARGVKKLGNPSPEASLARGHATQSTNKESHAKAIYGVLQGISKAVGAMTLQAQAEALNRLGYRSGRGGAFTATTVRRVLAIVQGNPAIA